jgi:hypothetical protein
MSRRWGYGRAHVPPLVVALLIGAGLSGCGKAHPPQTCSWATMPRGITSGDLVGTYQGRNAHGDATSMTLTADGRFTETNYQIRDWYSGTWLVMGGGTAWKFTLDRGRLDRLRGRPGAAFIDLDDDAHTTLKVGGTRADPVLYDSFNDSGASCDDIHSLLRQA